MSELVKVKTSELVGDALDWVVSEAIKVAVVRRSGGMCCGVVLMDVQANKPWSPSSNWSQGGPLIESEELTVEPSAWDWQGSCVLWRAHQEGESMYFEHTNLLVAAMRAIVHAKMGDTATVPDVLLS